MQKKKKRWSRHLADRIHQMANNSRDSWQATKTLKEGILGHHKSPDIMRFKKKDGTFTETDEEKFEKLSEHFQNV